MGYVERFSFIMRLAFGLAGTRAWFPVATLGGGVFSRVDQLRFVVLVRPSSLYPEDVTETRIILSLVGNCSTKEAFYHISPHISRSMDFQLCSTSHNNENNLNYNSVSGETINEPKKPT